MEIPYNDRAQVEAQAVAQAEIEAVAQAEIASVAQANANAGDRGGGDGESAKLPQPEISIIVDGNKIFKPGMKSVFIDDNEDVIISGGVDSRIDEGYCSCNSVNICTCNTVCTCEGVCTCEAVCSCVGNCSCDQVCSCDNHCSCDQVCTCNSQCTCQSQTRTGCSCAPVH